MHLDTFGDLKWCLVSSMQQLIKFWNHSKVMSGWKFQLINK